MFSGITMDDITINTETSINYNPIIKVVGVGGGGGNMLAHIANTNKNDVELIAVNTDAQALKSQPAQKIQIGRVLTGGLGAGAKPEIGKQAAEESYEDIKMALDGANLVFISVGLGGGTGTGAAPIVAGIAKELGALTVGVVTKPFLFEGKKKEMLANAGLEELKKECDSIIVLPNDKLLHLGEKTMGMKDSFNKINDILARCVNGVSGAILEEGYMNVDYADVRTVMSHRGEALLTVSNYKGDTPTANAISEAIESPLFNNLSLNGTKGLLLLLKIHPDYDMMELSQAVADLQGKTDETADVIFGTILDDSLDVDEVHLTIIATGFEDEEMLRDYENKGKNNTIRASQQSIMRNQNTGTNGIAHNQNSMPYRPVTNENLFSTPEPVSIRKVANSDYQKMEDLDMPTYLRKQQD